MGNRLKQLRQARPNWKVADAAQAFGYSESGYYKLEARESLSMKLIEKARRIYGVSIAEVVGNEALTDDVNKPLTNEIPPHHAANVVEGRSLQTTKETVPVYGLAVGGADGQFVFNGNVLEHKPAVPAVRGVADAYAVYVRGESMEPSLRAGWIVYVHPHREPRQGDLVVIQVLDKNGGPHLGFVKQLVSRDTRRVKVSQYNPDRTFDYPADRVVSVHKIVGIEPT